jgi:hypothetical protein
MMAQRTAPPPHRHTVILAVATIAAMIGTAVFVKASAQTTTNNGSGVAVDTNNGTINNNNNNTESNAHTCNSSAIFAPGAKNMVVEQSMSIGFECGVNMRDSTNSTVKDFSAVRSPR